MATLSAIHALAAGWAAVVLPWRAWSLIGVVASAVALTHLLQLLCILAGGRRARLFALDAVALVSFTALFVLTWAMASAAFYVARLHQGLGPGIAAVIAAAWGLCVLFTLPVACWAAAVTGLVPRFRRTVFALLGSAALLLVVSAIGARAAATPSPIIDDESAIPLALQAAVHSGVFVDESRRGGPPRAPFPAAMAFQCAEEPSPITKTLLLTARSPRGAELECIQAKTATQLWELLRERLARGDLRPPLGIDVAVAVHSFPADHPLIDMFGIQPASDGVCLGTKCLAPWQLVSLGELVNARPFPQIQDLRFGMSNSHVRARLEGPAPQVRTARMRRLLVKSYAIDRAGSPHPLERLRSAEEVHVRSESLSRASFGAEEYIRHAARNNGLFRYSLDAFSGQEDAAAYNLPRQAGVTLALCELGGPSSNDLIQRSLDFMAAHERRIGELSALARSNDPYDLGSTALPLIAFLTCRSRVTGHHDQLVGRLGRLLLHLQRANGSFEPAVDASTGRPIHGPDPLYAEGQAVYALVLLEQVSSREHRPELPTPEELGPALDRAMNFFGRSYFRHPLRDLFFIEENWHCLAARAALSSHRNDDYERFCIDVVRSQRRRVLEGNGVAPDLVGAFGLGTVVLPHATPTAGFGETLAAEIRIRRARGEDVNEDLTLLRKVLGFLLRFQWSSEACFACVPAAVGGFAEQHASAQVRIDYVQHAWSALVHGGRALGLLPSA